MITCADCNADVSKEDDFCWGCGKALPKNKPLKPKELREQQRHKKFYCGEGDPEKHALQCAGVKIDFFCPYCGQKITPDN